MANYDLYTELHLDKDMPPNGISEILSGRISDLKRQGYTADSPEIDQLETAQAILGEPYKRDVYEAALYGGPDDVVNIRWLHDLADAKTPAGGAEPQDTQGAPTSYSGPSEDPTRQQEYPGGSPLVSGVPGDSLDPGQRPEKDEPSASETSVIPQIQDEPTATESAEDTEFTAAPGDDSDGAESADSGADVDSADNVDSADGAGSADSAEKAAGIGAVGAGVAGAGAAAGAARSNSWQQPSTSSKQSPGFQGAPSSAGGFGQQQPPQKTGGSGIDTAKWALNGRSRSESKVYLGVLAVLAVGMLYPLIVLFTAGSNDLDAPISIFRAILFTLFWAVTLISVNEIIWGVRKIVAPDSPAAAGSTSGAHSANGQDAAPQK
jgi:hypothetical protein